MSRQRIGEEPEQDRKAGRLEQREYTTREGDKRTAIEVVADELGRVIANRQVARTLEDLLRYGGDRIVDINANTKAAIAKEVADLEAKADADLAAAQGRSNDELRAEISLLAAKATPIVIAKTLTDQTKNVWPMIPAGKGITEMILSEDL